MAKVEKICEVCNKKFKVFPAAAKRRKTCSRDCGYKIQSTLKFVCSFCGTKTKNKKYCSLTCTHKGRINNKQQQNYNKFINGELFQSRNIKPFVIERDGRKCSICQNALWNGVPITLWLDHIDGNASNNLPGNFRLVCPNCDSQSETFGGRNYGNGRRSRGMIPWSNKLN